MTTNRKLTIGIIGLLVVNLLVLAFFFTRHRGERNKGNDKRQNPRQMVIERLDFDIEQAANFNTLVEIHKKKIKNNDSVIWDVKTRIFNALGNDKQTNVYSLAAQIGELQENIEVAHYNHFMKVKALCKEDQLPKFTELSKELSEIFNSRRRSHKNKNKNKK